MRKNLLDIECLLLGGEKFKCEHDCVENIYTSDYIWEVVHRKKINYVDIIEGEFAYIEFDESGHLLIFLD